MRQDGATDEDDRAEAVGQGQVEPQYALNVVQLPVPVNNKHGQDANEYNDGRRKAVDGRHDLEVFAAPAETYKLKVQLKIGVKKSIGSKDGLKLYFKSYLQRPAV